MQTIWRMAVFAVGLSCANRASGLPISGLVAAVLRETQVQCPYYRPPCVLKITRSCTPDCKCVQTSIEYRPAGTACGAFLHAACGTDTGSCDGQGHCMENLAPAGTVCRPAAGECDLPESCTGSSLACPDDGRAINTICRPAAGSCDIDELCDGVSVSCPSDGKRLPGWVCRPGSLAECTLDAQCDGGNAFCPANPPAPAGMLCSPGSDASCTADATCDGASAGCPRNGPAIAGTLCRPTAGTCDEPETCNGRSTVCPRDAFKSQGLVCETARTTCELDAACTGTEATCPEHRILPNSTPCETGSVCVAGNAACLAGVCSGGTRLVYFESTDLKATMRWNDNGPPASENATAVLRHAQSGPPIELVSASVEPSDSFRLVAQPSWPISLSAGESISITVGVAATRVGTYEGTLTVRATGCSEPDIQVPVLGTLEGRVSKMPGCGSPSGGWSLVALSVPVLFRRSWRNSTGPRRAQQLRRSAAR